MPVSLKYISLISKGTLHYMKQNAKSDKQFTLNASVLESVNMWEALKHWFQVKSKNMYIFTVKCKFTVEY
ncbi:hypothetical protein DU30_00170 [Methanosarcina mazei]|uniref:Uncharacterized protein n=1 Tax=Methanosarcina mazei TaxID=2209 RepID=A0A0F8EXR8_METMZ|nr:hypothetical protein DU30_00170 [Methanosarcina mazei]